MATLTFEQATHGLGQYLFNFSALMPDEDDDLIEGDWSDEEDEDYDATEEEFNDYCEEQLRKANMLSPNQ